MPNEISPTPQMPVTPAFERGTTIPPEVKVFHGGIAVGYLYPNLQVKIRDRLQMPHGNQSLKQVLLREEVDHQTIPPDVPLLERIVEGETREIGYHDGKKEIRTGGMRQEVAHALDQAGVTHEEITQRNIPDDKRQEYIQRMQATRMHGLRNIHFEEASDGHLTAVMDTVGISYPFYRNIRNPQLPEEMLALSNPTGNAVILETSDNKFVLQYRRPYDPLKRTGNVMHGGIPGASAAGMWKITVDHPTTNARQEAHEELGLHIGEKKDDTINPVQQAKRIAAKELHLQVDDIAQMYITGLAGDLSAVHAEVLLLGKINIDSATLEQRSLHARFYANDPEYDFEEQFVTLPATSESIVKLLTQVKCPLPANHIAAFAAAGLAKRQEELLADTSLSDIQRRSLLDQWYQALEAGIQKNYADIDRLAGGHYDFGKTPSTQDIPTPSFQAEMKRVFGIDFSEEKAQRTEALHQPANAYLFDIDGVITDPNKKEVVFPQILREIMIRLNRKEPVGFNTGRSLTHIQEKILKPLGEMIDRANLDRGILANLVAIGEKGGAWITFDEEGTPTAHVNPHLVVPEELQDTVRGLVASGLRTMYYDETKQTMITVEMRDNPTEEQQEEFHHEQDQLVDAINQTLIHLGRQQEFTVDKTRIAVDVQHNGTGKALGAKLFFDMLSERGIHPKRFISAGDSKSDFDMHKQLQQLGAASHFLYVGDPEDLAGENINDVTFSKNNGYQLNQGTYFFLV